MKYLKLIKCRRERFIWIYIQYIYFKRTCSSTIFVRKTPLGIHHHV